MTESEVRARTLSVDALLGQPGFAALAAEFGRTAARDDLCAVLSGLRRDGGRSRTRRPWLERTAAAFRTLPRPVIGPIGEGALRFDLRTLEDEAGFLAQVPAIGPKIGPGRAGVVACGDMCDTRPQPQRTPS